MSSLDLEKLRNKINEDIFRDPKVRSLGREFVELSASFSYSYNFDALGVPIIQYPQDIVAMQELIWKVKPDLIIETGIAHGGSLIMSASMLALLSWVTGGRVDTYSMICHFCHNIQQSNHTSHECCSILLH
jgi:cephalosporin hydroxylase